MLCCAMKKKKLRRQASQARRTGNAGAGAGHAERLRRLQPRVQSAGRRQRLAVPPELQRRRIGGVQPKTRVPLFAARTFDATG